jgi:hypothetical protein
MFRTLAMVSMAVMCVAAAALMGAAWSVETVQDDAAIESNDGATQAHNVPNIGCIGFHGTGSGYAANGRCVG